MIRWFRWHLAKLRLTQAEDDPADVMWGFVGHQARLEDFPPDTVPYERLATLWDDYFAGNVPRYGRFLASAARIHCYPIESALDLACGTGMLTRELAAHFATVVGLDISEAMLREAGSRSEGSGIRYLRGDFRDFALGRTFHAITCGSDSLNYVERPEQLTDVFRCIERHLSPGGFFVFDTFGHAHFCSLAGVKTVGTAGGQRFELYFFYDEDRRISESRAVFADAVERHRRIPIDACDVDRAASLAGLKSTDRFSGETYRAKVPPPVRSFYVLRKGLDHL